MFFKSKFKKILMDEQQIIIRDRALCSLKTLEEDCDKSKYTEEMNRFNVQMDLIDKLLNKYTK